MKEENLHASCVSVEGEGILIRGPSGSGKSDLSLRLIQEGARLVGDDQLWVFVRDGGLYARPPAEIRGLLEVRGVGIVRFESQDEAPLRLIVDLVSRAEVPRLPEREHQALLGVHLPRISLFPFEPSATIKLRLFLRQGLSEK